MALLLFCFRRFESIDSTTNECKRTTTAAAAVAAVDNIFLPFLPTIFPTFSLESIRKVLPQCNITKHKREWFFAFLTLCYCFPLFDVIFSPLCRRWLCCYALTKLGANLVVPFFFFILLLNLPPLLLPPSSSSSSLPRFSMYCVCICSEWNAQK